MRSLRAHLTIPRKALPECLGCPHYLTDALQPGPKWFANNPPESPTCYRLLGETERPAASVLLGQLHPVWSMAAWMARADDARYSLSAGVAVGPLMSMPWRRWRMPHPANHPRNCSRTAEMHVRGAATRRLDRSLRPAFLANRRRQTIRRPLLRRQEFPSVLAQLFLEQTQVVVQHRETCETNGAARAIWMPPDEAVGMFRRLMFGANVHDVSIAAVSPDHFGHPECLFLTKQTELRTAEIHGNYLFHSGLDGGNTEQRTDGRAPVVSDCETLVHSICLQNR